MIVLHSGVYDGRVLLWGETSAQSEAVLPTRRRGRKLEVSHPPSRSVSDLEHPTPVRPVQKLDGVYDPDLEPSLLEALLDLK